MIKTIPLFPGVTLRCCRDARFKQGVLSYLNGKTFKVKRVWFAEELFNQSI